MTNEARQAILSSIRSHLAASVPYDKRELLLHPVNSEKNPAILSNQPSDSLVETFKANLDRRRRPLRGRQRAP